MTKTLAALERKRISLVDTLTELETESRGYPKRKGYKNNIKIKKKGIYSKRKQIENQLARVKLVIKKRNIQTHAI